MGTDKAAPTAPTIIRHWRGVTSDFACEAQQDGPGTWHMVTVMVKGITCETCRALLDAVRLMNVDVR